MRITKHQISIMLLSKLFTCTVAPSTLDVAFQHYSYFGRKGVMYFLVNKPTLAYT